MLQPILHILNSKKIVLASASPRRQELAKNIGLSNIILCPSLFEEDLDPNSFKCLEDFVEETALQKVLEVEQRLIKDNVDLIIGADTMVALDGKLFGKPSNNQEAFNMLSQLSGRSHTVYTGVVVKTSSDIIKFCEKTKVCFGVLDDEQINGYIKTGEPLDKAGGYGIQGIGGSMVEKIEGDYFTVMGLPLFRLSKVLYDIYGNKK